MENLWEAVFPATIAATIATGLVQLLAQYHLTRMLEKFRSELNREVLISLEQTRHQKAVDLERIKTLERIIASQAEARFKVLEEKRAEKIAAVFADAIDFRDAAAIAHLKPSPDEEKDYAEKYVRFRRTVRQNRLWFSRNIAEKLWKFLNENEECVTGMRIWSADGVENERARGEIIAERRKFFERFKIIESTLLADLEREFRLLLGVSDSAPAPQTYPPNQQ